MSNQNNGGPAFPIPGLHHDSDFNGATLRDYFAAKAMQGDWSNGNEGTWGNDANISDLEKRAALYYRMADAMLKERDK